MSNCSKYSELISAYADCEVTNDEKTLVEKHVAECANCKQKLDFILKTKEVLKDTPPMPVPESLFADFAEFKKKSEEQEKKVVPFYKNYRMYASIAAVFVFAFVLKSGLWQEDNYLPDQTTQGTYGQQTLTAAKQKTSAENNTVEPAVTSDVSSSGNNAKQQADVQLKNQPVQNASKTVENETDNVSVESEIQLAKEIQPETVPGQTQDVPVQETEIKTSDQVTQPAVLDGDDSQTASGGGGGTSAYSRTSEDSKIAEDNSTQQEQTTVNAQIYVSEQHLEKAKQLLSGDSYFFHQVEQKMSDNRIPFESNFLLLDESQPYQIQVLVKSE